MDCVEHRIPTLFLALEGLIVLAVAVYGTTRGYWYVLIPCLLFGGFVVLWGAVLLPQGGEPELRKQAKCSRILSRFLTRIENAESVKALIERLKQESGEA